MSNGVTKRNEDITFADIICNSPEEENAKKLCVEFVNNMPHCKNMIFTGKPGTGKTFHASAIINELALKRETGAIRTVRQIVRQFEIARNFNSPLSESGVLNSLINSDVLVIDEVGIGKANDQEKFILHDIIDGRYGEMKPTILISNLTGKEVGENIGERLISRLKQDIEQVKFKWGSKR